MEFKLESDVGTLVWVALSLAIAALSTHLALAWVEVAPAGGRGARWRRPLGAGLTLGTGMWALHGITAAMEPALRSAGYPLVVEATLWAIGVIASLLTLGAADARRTGLPQQLLAASVLSAGAVGLLVLGALAAGPASPPAGWNLWRLAAAAGVCAAGFAAMFRIGHAMRPRDRVTRTRARAGAAAIGGLGLVLAQQLVMRAPGGAPAASPPAPGQLSGTALAALALALPVAVLLLSRHLLQRQLRAQAARQAARREAAPNALNDPLTGLPTRQLFDGLLAQAVRAAETRDERLALLLVNLDGFKPINQAFGHLGGDQVLREVAARLRALSSPHMTARMAGDEGGKLLPFTVNVK